MSRRDSPSAPPVDIREAARRLGVTPSIVRGLLRQGLLGHHKMGSGRCAPIRIAADEIESFLESSYRPPVGLLPPEAQEVKPDDKPRRRRSSQAEGFKHLRRFGYVPKVGA